MIKLIQEDNNQLLQEIHHRVKIMLLPNNFQQPLLELTRITIHQVCKVIFLQLCQIQIKIHKK